MALDISIPEAAAIVTIAVFILAFIAWGFDDYESKIDPSRPKFRPGYGFLNRKRKRPEIH